MDSSWFRSRTQQCGDRTTIQRYVRVRTAPTPTADGTGQPRLYLAPTPGVDDGAVAAVLEARHGFIRLAVADRTPAGCACTDPERAKRLREIGCMGGRIVVEGVACEQEARLLHALGFFGVVISDARRAAVRTARTLATAPRPDRGGAVPRACAGAVTTADYILDTGRDPRLAATHIDTLLAVVETLADMERSHRQGPLVLQT